MLLYWGMFTLGFLFGSILSFVTFAPKKPEDDLEYETKNVLSVSKNKKRLTADKVPDNLILPDNSLILDPKRPNMGTFQNN